MNVKSKDTKEEPAAIQTGNYKDESAEKLLKELRGVNYFQKNAFEATPLIQWKKTWHTLTDLKNKDPFYFSETNPFRAFSSLPKRQVGEKFLKESILLDKVSPSGQKSPEESLDTKPSGADNTLMEARVAKLEADMEHVKADIGEISSRLKSLDEKVDRKFDALNLRVDDVNKKIDQRFDILNQRFNERIDSLNQHFDKRIEDLNGQLDKRITDLNNKLDKRIEGLNDQLDKRITGFNDQLNKRITGFNDQLNNRIDSLSTQLTGWHKWIIRLLVSVIILLVSAIGTIVYDQIKVEAPAQTPAVSTPAPTQTPAVSKPAPTQQPGVSTQAPQAPSIKK